MIKRGERQKKSASHGESGYERVANDAYFTPAWVTEVLLSAYRPGHFGTLVWEPACGNGQMVEVLRAAKYSVFYSDIHNYGYRTTCIIDFLANELMSLDVNAIITNPPFGAKSRQFIERSVSFVEPRRGKVAILQRHEFDAPASHHYLFKHPFSAKIVLPKRPKWNDEDRASPRFPYAWYVWDWEHVGLPHLRYVSKVPPPLTGEP